MPIPTYSEPIISMHSCICSISVSVKDGSTAWMDSRGISLYSGRASSLGRLRGYVRGGSGVLHSAISTSAIVGTVVTVKRMEALDLVSLRRLACSTLYFGLFNFPPPLVRARRGRAVELCTEECRREVRSLGLAGGMFSVSVRLAKLDCRSMVVLRWFRDGDEEFAGEKSEGVWKKR